VPPYCSIAHLVRMAAASARRCRLIETVLRATMGRKDATELDSQGPCRTTGGRAGWRQLTPIGQPPVPEGRLPPRSTKRGGAESRKRLIKRETQGDIGRRAITPATLPQGRRISSERYFSPHLQYPTTSNGLRRSLRRGLGRPVTPKRRPGKS